MTQQEKAKKPTREKVEMGVGWTVTVTHITPDRAWRGQKPTRVAGTERGRALHHLPFRRVG